MTHGRFAEDPDEIIAVEDPGADNDPFAAIFPDANKGNKNKNDKTQKDKKAAKAITPTCEAHIFTVVGTVVSGKPAPWERTRRKQLPLSSKEIYDSAQAAHNANRVSSEDQFNSLGPKQQSIVTCFIDDKNDEENDPNAIWTLFDVRRLYIDQRQSLTRVARVNNALKVTILRQDRAAATMPGTVDTKSAATNVDPEIFDINKPRIKKKDATAKDTTKPKKKKPAPPEDDNNFQGWDGVPQQNNPDPWAQQPQAQQWAQQDPYGHPQQNPFRAQDQFPPQEPDPFNMQNMQNAIPVPPDQREFVPPVAPMAPGHDHQQPPNAFQPYPHVHPQPDPNAFSTFDDRQPQDFATQAPHTSARRNESTNRSHDHRDSRSRSIGHDRERSRSRHHRRNSSDSDRIRRMEEKFDTKFERNAEKLDNLTGMMSVQLSNNKVSNWGTAGYTSSSTNSRDGGSSHRSSYGRGYSTPGTSPERNILPRGSLKYSRLTKPHYRRRGGRDYPEEGYNIEPAISYRHGRGYDGVRIRDGEWDDYPPQLSPQRSRPRVVNYPENDRPRTFMRRHTEGTGTDFMKDDGRERVYVHEEPRRHRRDDFRDDRFSRRYS